jgi:hypothetical protein
MPQRKLDVHADLSVSVDGDDFTVRGTGREVTIEVPSLRAGRKLLNTPLSGQAQTRRVHEALRQAGVTARVVLNGATIARIGADAQPGAATKLLRLGQAEVRPAAAAAASARQSPWTWLLALAGTGLLAWLLIRYFKD